MSLRDLLRPAYRWLLSPLYCRLDAQEAALTALATTQARLDSDLPVRLQIAATSAAAEAMAGFAPLKERQGQLERRLEPLETGRAPPPAALVALSATALSVAAEAAGLHRLWTVLPISPESLPDGLAADPLAQPPEPVALLPGSALAALPLPALFALVARAAEGLEENGEIWVLPGTEARLSASQAAALWQNVLSAAGFEPLPMTGAGLIRARRGLAPA